MAYQAAIQRERVVFPVRLCLPGIPSTRPTPRRREALMRAHPRPLIAVGAAIPDGRQPRGTRHPCAALFALAGGALVCGARRASARAAGGRHEGTRRAQALGFPPRPAPF